MHNFIFKGVKSRISLSDLQHKSYFQIQLFQERTVRFARAEQLRLVSSRNMDFYWQTAWKIPQRKKAIRYWEQELHCLAGYAALNTVYRFSIWFVCLSCPPVCLFGRLSVSRLNTRFSVSALIDNLASRLRGAWRICSWDHSQYFPFISCKFWIRYWAHIATSSSSSSSSSCGATSYNKSPSLRRYKSDRDEIWRDCSPSKYASTDWSQISAMTS